MPYLLNKASIGAKLRFFLSLVLAVVFLVLSFILYKTQEEKLLTMNEERMFSHVDDVVNMFQVQNAEKTLQVKAAIKTAGYLLAKSGLTEVDSMVTLQATAADSSTFQVEVPLWLLDSVPLQTGNFVLVDKVQELAGTTATIFQKIPQGYLRVSTNVLDSTGNRSVGTFIPADSPVAQKIDNGGTYSGRNFVVDDWYKTVYRPIHLNGKVAGMLAVAIREKDMQYLRKTLLSKKYFDTGYPYCADSKGMFIIHPAFEGQSGAQYDFMQDMLQNKRGKSMYLWPQDGTGTLKRAYYQYFEPYDLYVSATVYEAEFYEKPLAQLRNIIFGTFLLSLVLVVLGVNLVSGHIAKPLKRLSENISHLAEGRTVIIEPGKRQDEVGKMMLAIQKLAAGLADYTRFASAIGERRFNEPFKPLSSGDTLGNSLVEMRDKLILVQQDDAKRNWGNNGLADFANLLRKNHENLEDLCSKVLSYLVKFIDARAGAVYLAEETPEGNKALVMKACYAWGRKKFVEQQLQPGEGLAGQVFLEKKKMILKEVPAGFLKITSGLGEAEPDFVLIMPLKIQEDIYGVMELVSFNEIEEYQITFLESICEAFTSSVASVKITEKTGKLLQESQMKTQQLSAQEEEMRQNMEELEATQEEMRRRDTENQEVIAQLNEQLKALRNGKHP